MCLQKKEDRRKGESTKPDPDKTQPELEVGQRPAMATLGLGIINTSMCKMKHTNTGVSHKHYSDNVSMYLCLHQMQHNCICYSLCIVSHNLLTSDVSPWEKENQQQKDRGQRNINRQARQGPQNEEHMSVYAAFEDQGYRSRSKIQSFCQMSQH